MCSCFFLFFFFFTIFESIQHVFFNRGDAALNLRRLLRADSLEEALLCIVFGLNSVTRHERLRVAK